MTRLRHIWMPWPDPLVPENEPVWMAYEIDTDTDSVLRMVECFADGRLTRNSIALEQRNGDDCPSLIERSAMEVFTDPPGTTLTPEAFQALWLRGEDQPVWFP